MQRNYHDRKPRSEFEEQVVHIDRISRTVAGGRRIRFRAAVVVGNRNGKVGIGVAKASEVILAVQKAITSAKKRLVVVPIVNDTIPYEIESQYGAAKVLLKPASQGTGIIAGGAVRAIASLAGIKNLLSKILGSQNQINNLRATIKALREFQADNNKIQLRTESLAKMKKNNLIKVQEKISQDAKNSQKNSITKKGNK